MLACVLGCASAPPAIDEQAVTVILPRDAEALDPRFISDPYGIKVSRLVFASLVTIDPDTLEPVPDLAKSVEVQAPTRYVATLRDGLRFSDGSALTSADVVATYRGVVDPRLRSRYANTYQRIRSVTATGPTTVVFELREPHATFITDLEFPILRAADAFTPIAGPAQPAPVGAGPYRIAARAPGRITLSANPHWHRGSPTFPRVQLVVVRDDNTRALRLISGAGDIALAAIAPLLIPLFENDPDFTVRSVPGIATTYLGFQTEAPALNDKRVRQAIALAVDRERLIEAKFGGRAELASGWIPQGHWAFNADVPVYAYDPARARQLLEAAGFPDPDGDGPAPRMNLLLRTNSDRARVSIAKALAAMLREVGIEVEVRPSETATMIADLNRGNFQLTLLQVPEVIEPHVLSWFFASDRVPGGGEEGANRWRYRNPALDAALEAGRRTADRDARKRHYDEVQRILAEDLPVVPLWQPHVVAVVRKGIDFRVPRDGRFSTLAH